MQYHMSLCESVSHSSKEKGHAGFSISLRESSQRAGPGELQLELPASE